MWNKERPVYRNEWKYLISEPEYAAVRLRASEILKPDPNGRGGSYMIRSLYFDDYWDSALEEKDMGVCFRKKYRIRVYNCSDSRIRLERKMKAGNYIHKDSAPLSREEAEMLIQGDGEFLLHNKFPLCREFYVEHMCHVMRPKVIVDYERDAFILDEGTVRVTFDQHVRAAVLATDLFDSELPCLEVLKPGTLVMEVKFTEFLPRLVRDLIPPGAAEFTALSKYVLCRRKTEYLSGMAYWEE